MKHNYSSTSSALKRTLSALLLLLVSTLSWAQYSYDFEIDSIYYRIRYQDSTTVEVTHSPDGWGQYSGDIVIPSTVVHGGKTYSVTSIGCGAFMRCSSLTSISIPQGVTEIEANAFEDCTSLTSVSLPEGVTSIIYRAFAYCTSLTSISLPESLTEIGFTVFMGCTSLTSIYIPQGVTEIDGSAFAYCTSLYSVIVSADNPVYDSRQWCNAIIETATNTLVAGCSNCFIPEGVTSIKENALCGFTFSRIDIPKSVTSMGGNTFMGCTSLSTIIVHGGNPVYDSRQGCNAIIETKTNTLVAGCNGTFIPESVTSIGDNAFEGCSSLTSIDIPESVTSIGDNAFEGCSSLTSIDIPESVTSIGGRAFEDCSSLTSITVAPGNSVYDSRQECNAIIETETNTLVIGCQNTVIPEGVTSIGDNAFESCSSLASISIPEGVTSIGVQAFYGCTSLASISIPEGVTSIGGGAFSGCSSLASISIPEGVTSIEGDAFRGCTSLTSIDIPEGVTSIRGGAFEGCSSLTSIDIPEGVTSIRGGAFEGCSSLTSIDIPEGVTSIGNYTFYGCTSLTSIDIPEGVTSIGNYAFYGCTSLTSIDLPESVTSIGNSAFRGCTSLTSIDLPESVTSIGDWAFCGCSTITNVICRAEKVPYASDAFTYTPIDKATLYVPASSINAYKAADGWKDFGTIRPLEDYETGIDTPAALQPDEAAATAAPYYTLGGQRVNAPVRGHIYIRSGRKVIY